MRGFGTAGSVIRTAALVVAVLGPGAALGQGIQGPDTGSGCMALGNGPTVTVAYCEYLAPDDGQSVIAATLSPWEIFVVRCCSKENPSECSPVLGEDGNPPEPLDFNCLEPKGADGRPVNTPVTVTLAESEGSDVTSVHPLPGELVTVFFGSGAIGFVSVGQDEALVPGGLPLP